MHEVSLMENVLRAVAESAAQNQIQKVTKIKLVVGKLTAALPDALSFAFTVLKEGTIFAGAELEIEEKEIKLYCRTCKKEFACQEWFICPSCAGNQTEVRQGRELYIDYYEGNGKGD